MTLDSQTHHGAGHRSERLAEEIRHEVTLMLAGELKDPRLALPLTVTEVRLSPDMRSVRVFVQLEGTDEERAAGMEGLKAAAKFVRHELIDRLHLRRAPEVFFSADESELYGNRIDTLLQKLEDPKKKT